MTAAPMKRPRNYRLEQTSKGKYDKNPEDLEVSNPRTVKLL